MKIIRFSQGTAAFIVSNGKKPKLRLQKTDGLKVIGVAMAKALNGKSVANVEQLINRWNNLSDRRVGRQNAFHLNRINDED
jgi:hypothetical protein